MIVRSSAPAKGVVVEFDTAVADGAEVLFATAKKFLAALDSIAFDDRVEAERFAGKGLAAALAGYFRVVKTKKTAPKAAKDLTVAYTLALNEAVPKAVGSSFRNFVKTLAEKRVKVVIATQAELLAVTDAFVGLHGQRVPLSRVVSEVYGGLAMTDWHALCERHAISPSSTVAVAGSGNSARAAFRAGLIPVVVPHDRTAYQDCGGAELSLAKLDTAAAKRLLRTLRVQ